MKKIVLMMLALSLCLVSCKNSKKDEFHGYTNYEKLVTEDVELYQGDGVFYESQIEFDTFVSIKNAVPIQILNVFQLNDTCIQVLHDNLGVTTVTKEKGYWLEDMAINWQDSVMITLNEAIDSLGVKVDSKFCTLRRPLTKEFYTDAFYIFGDQKFGHFYTVNTMTGDVSEME